MHVLEYSFNTIYKYLLQHDSMSKTFCQVKLNISPLLDIFTMPCTFFLKSTYFYQQKRVN